MRDDLNLPLLYSVIAHLIFILMVTIKAALFPENAEHFEPALRVDLVDLPEKFSQSTKKPMNTTKFIEPVAPNPPEMAPLQEGPKAAPEMKPNMDSRLSAAQAIERLKKKMAIDKIRQEVTDQERSQLSERVAQYKGNVLAPGTELVGINKLQHEDYLHALDVHVKGFWRLPEWLARGNYRAQVRVLLDSQGMLLGSELIQRSGNPNYDEIVLETVKNAAPFPVPPEKFRAIVSVSGMVLGFPE